MRVATVFGTFRFLVPLGLGVLWCGLLPFSATAQPTRAEMIAREQALKPLGPEGPSSLERFVVWLKRSPLISYTSGPYPYAGSFYPGSGLALGAGYIQRWPDKVTLNVRAAASVRGSVYALANARLPNVTHDISCPGLEARRTVAKDLSFYGLGPNSSSDNPQRYDYRFTELAAIALLHPVHLFELSGKYMWLTPKTEARAPGPSATSDLEVDLSYNVVQAGATIDWRTAPGYSTRGGFHRVTWSRYFEAQGHPFGFQQFEYEGIQLVPILRAQYVLAGHVMATFTTIDKGDRLPFVLAPTLGGAETLRGFPTRRFTDRDRLLLNFEYRWLPSRWIDMAIFFDAGKVGRRAEDLGLAHMQTDWGLGVRFHARALTVLRAEIARSSEGWEFFLSERRAF